MVRQLLWDNDGVLVATEHLYFQANAEVLAEVGVALSEAQFVEISLRRGESVLELAQSLSATDRKELRQKRNQRYCELLSITPLVMEGVRETLEQLHGQYPMAIVTSCHRDHFDIIHQSSGLLPFFDFVLTREDYGLSKPHPEPYLTAVRQSGCASNECLVIEDSLRGLQSAVKAGIPCFVIPGKLNADSDMSQANRILNHVREIPAALASLT